MFLKEFKEDLKEYITQDYRLEPLATGIYIYVKNPEEVPQEAIKDLVHKFKKRVYIRKDPAYLRDENEKEVKKRIAELLPKDAQLISIDFAPDFSEAFIRVKFPRYAKSPELIERILKETGWYPIFVREPQLPSSYFDSIYLYKIKTDRKALLKKVGKRILDRADDEVKWITTTMLGGFREVGRSSLLVETNISKVIVDMGVHPSPSTPEETYPMINLISSLNDIDAIVISHAHTDHVAFLPYLFKAGYEGPVYMTKPTLDLAVLLQHDFISISKKTLGDSIYDKADIKKMINHTITVDYGEVIDISRDIKLSLYNAGHILGSSVVHLHIGEGKHNIVFSGDIKYGPTRLFDPAYNKFTRAETIFIESTYGTQRMPNRKESEERLVAKIKETIERGGKVLIPAFAVGRSQEVIVTLYEKADKDWNIPVYIDGMVYEASSIHSAYPEYLKSTIREQFLSNESPFNWEYLKVVKNKDKTGIVNTDEGSVIIAPSGMLTGGPSVEYLKLLAEDPRNTLIFIGYQAKGTLGSKIQQGMKSVPIKEDNETRELHINMEVTTIEGFSGHSDSGQLLAWLSKMPAYRSKKVKKVFTMHGDADTTVKFASTIRKRLNVPASAPMNMERRRLR
ncbi:MAG: beta-CASP ribonuclease aCPSF1 [Candidatus Micrarchaeota archaeon]|nr:beta-CASP ribonuclease aCPSF1 [Candidatus Micrarchaeota archaeon]